MNVLKTCDDFSHILLQKDAKRWEWKMEKEYIDKLKAWLKQKDQGINHEECW